MNPERLLENNITEEETQKIFHFFGFTDIKQADKNLKKLIQTLGGDVFFLKSVIARLFAIIKALADPDRAFINFLRFLENSKTPFIHFNFLTQQLENLRVVFRIFSDSQFFSEILIKNPEYLDWLFENNYTKERSYEEMLSLAYSWIQPIESYEDKIMALRRFQKKEFLRIVANDLLGKSSLETIVSELSYLADTCMQVIYEIKKKEIQEKENTIEFDLAIISMGKLGGKELNYSSDIDIVFVGEGDLFYATKLALEINKELTAFSEEGYFYRVDTRLRPEGDKGELVRSLESFENYFENRARVWEKQAYLKARFSAGNKILGEKFEQIAKRFVFKKYLSIDEINAIKKLKKSIENKALEKQEWKREVKIGYGGIRDIEFFVQFIQLLYGGRYPKLKTGTTLRALRVFNEIDLISYNEYITLSKHYIFLRRVEHFLQIMEYQQTHLLPDKERQKYALAIRMGFKSTEEFFNYYTQVTEEVRQIFIKYFEEVYEEQEQNLAEKFFNASKAEDIEEILKQYGFQDIQKVFYLIKHTVINTKNEFLFFAALENIFLSLKNNSHNPDKALVNIIRIINAYRGEDVFFEILKNSKDFLHILVKITSFSDFIVEIIEKNPAVLDILTEISILNQRTNKKELGEIFYSLKQDVGEEKAISLLYEMEIFRIAVQDILGIKNLPQITASLTFLAEALLNQNLKNHPPISFAIIFLGKLAGRELSYHSDLDMIFLIESEDIEENYLLTQFLQKFIEKLKPIYEMDLRLRPDGKNTNILISFTSFQKYLHEKAEDWERLIYSRSKIYATSSSFYKKIRETIHHFVYRIENFELFKKNIAEMRKKIVHSFPDNNFKKSSGGIMDLEFIIEYYKILYQIHSPNLFSVLKALVQKDPEQREWYEKLRKHYFFLRQLENTIRLIHNQYDASFENLNKEIQFSISQKMGFSSLEELKEIYYQTRQSIVEYWQEFVNKPVR